MDNLTFKCMHCREELDAPTDMAGQQVECPGCGKTIEVPTPAVATGLPKAEKPVPRTPRQRIPRRPEASRLAGAETEPSPWRWLKEASRPRWFFAGLAAFALLALIGGILVVVREETEPSPALLVMGRIIGVFWLPSMCRVAWSILMWVWAILLLPFRLPSIIRQRSADRQASYEKGDYISFMQLTAEYREDPVWQAVLKLCDILMFPFPCFFGQYSLPSVFLPRWSKWKFLQMTAVAFLTWVYIVQIVTFYGAGITVFIVVIEEGFLTALWVTVGAMFLAGLIVTFSLLLAKAVVEIASVFMKIEENTGARAPERTSRESGESEKPD